MYETIKKILNDGGKCLLIEDGKPVGMVLTMADYEKLSELPLDKGGDKGGLETEKTLFSENTPPQAPPAATHPIGEAMAQEMDYPEASADLADIEDADSVTLQDLGLDELPY